jgi:predicted ester cyclase
MMWEPDDGRSFAIENKAIIYRFVTEGLNERKLQLIDEFYAGDYIGHEPERGQTRRLAGLKEALAHLLGQAFSDARYIIESLTAEDDMIVCHWTFCANHTGEWMGIQPTGKPVIAGGVNIFRMANGKVVEDWEYRDTLGILIQIGALPDLVGRA